MKQIQYVAKFRYDGIVPGQSERKFLEKAYMLIYNMFCDLVNPQLDGWNKSYNGVNDGFNPNGEYNSYIRQKEQQIADSLNEQLFKFKEDAILSRIKRFFIGEECDFRIELNDGTTMQMYLKEV